MKRKILAGCLLAAMATPAIADLRISSGQSGDALYAPFYTVNGGQQTLLSVRNDTAASKAIRVNFVEALNGQQVLAFHLYLAPFDTWTAALTSDAADGPAQISSSDASCTAPDVAASSPVDFLPFDYADNFPDGGPSDLARTRMGAIEIIELGELDGSIGEEVADFDCVAVFNAFEEGGMWREDFNVDVTAPTGGLNASVEIVNVGEGTFYSTPVYALNGFAERPHQHFPGDTSRRITSPVAAADEDGFVATLADGTSLSFPADRGADAVSALFANVALTGEFMIDDSLGATTTWVVGFPTKHAYVFSGADSLIGANDPVEPPFTSLFDGEGACEPAAVILWDRDGMDVGSTADEDSIELCAQTSVVHFDGSVDEREEDSIIASADAGTAQLQFTGSMQALQDAVEVELPGLPVVGMRITNYINADAQPGMLANYAGSEALRAEPGVAAVPIDQAASEQ